MNKKGSEATHDAAVEQLIAGGGYGRAIDYIDAVIGDNPDNAELLGFMESERAKVLAIQGETDRAEASLERARQLMHNAVKSDLFAVGVLNTKGIIALDRQSWHEADSNFQAVESLTSDA